MPRKILTKKGLQFLKWLLNKIVNHTIGMVIIALLLISAFFIFKSGILDKELKFTKAP